jgi:Domain of unknown function (DUF4160)
MPRLSAFYGIVIWMYPGEGHHGGRPHFHAEYAEDEASFDIETLEVIAGRLPRRATRLVNKWAAMHRSELRANWQRARAREPLIQIDPLP